MMAMPLNKNGYSRKLLALLSQIIIALVVYIVFKMSTDIRFRKVMFWVIILALAGHFT